MKLRTSAQSGFTLVEMLVSILLFAIVMVVCVGALLSLVGANKKAQALESVMNNLNISLDSMVRNARQGTNFHCGAAPFTTSQDCAGGDVEFAFEPYNGDKSTSDQWVFQFVCPGGMSNGTCVSGGYIQRSEDGGASWMQETSPEVSITSMAFYVIGSTPGDTIQPRVIIQVTGTAGGGSVKVLTKFHLQLTAVERVLDL